MTNNTELSGTPASKYRTNITLALIWEYELTDLATEIAIRDVICELAVNDTNTDPDILPYTYINAVRVNMWDPEYANLHKNGMNSGGYATVRVIEALQSTGALLAVGEFNGAIAITSINQVFKKVISTIPARDFEDTMSANEISVLTKIQLNPSVVKTGDYTLSYETLRNVDARYIVIIADTQLTADFYFKSSNYSLIGPKMVWIGFNLPWSLDGFTKEQTHLFQGFVFTNPDTPDFSSEPVQNFSNEYLSAYNQSNGSIPFDISVFQVGPYDCVKLMMLGIHEFMEANPQYTPEMLANGSLNHFLTPDKFAKTGYNGVTYQPIELDKNGDFIV
ncbi:hypothetical protein HDU76_005700 [Blyttiomyces sp. JEL0837]|nr:hypothetical protein HDU76_005700 [Blyttiomyces sp. JEL0837]